MNPLLLFFRRISEIIADRRLSLSNWYFNQLPAHLRRVRIAKDVIARIQAEDYYVGYGNYIDSRTAYTLIDFPAKETQKQALKLKHCRVCALGGLIVSSIRLFNHTVFSGTTGEPSSAHQYLLQHFSELMLLRIEYAFEENHALGARFSAFAVIPQEEREKLRAAFYDNVDVTPDMRLIAIMRNIIRNRGELVV